MIEKKYCVTCKSIKNLMPKPYHKVKNDSGEVIKGYYMCRGCNTQRVKKYRKSAQGMEKTKTAIYRYMKNNPNKTEARVRVATALRHGELIRSALCLECSKEGMTDAHHDDYNKPLDVRWLCRSCHADTHREIEKYQLA